MKKHFIFLLVFLFFSTLLFAQDNVEKPVPVKKPPHLTFGLQDNTFYYQKGNDTAKHKIEVVDSSAIAAIINAAIVQNKVAPKNLNVILQGDDLMHHPHFELVLDTILSKTVSEVRIKTNVLD